MKETFGILPSGESASLYTIRGGDITAAVTDYGANLVRLLVPDSSGAAADIVLGYDDCNGYRVTNGACLGAIVGRNANRLGGASFELNGRRFQIPRNERGNNLHSGPDFYFQRMWKVVSHLSNAITLELNSPDGDQGFPGNAVIRVTYSLDNEAGLHVIYDGICDQDTVFNMTNHSYFNLAGHDKTGAAMDQILTMPARFFNPDDAENIPTGELRSVEGSPMDFRTPKAIGRDISQDYDALNLQGGYDHNWEVFRNPCATLYEPNSGRKMEVYTDCPGVQFYSANFLDEKGKDGVHYCRRSGICLETQFYPDSLHHSGWPQPITRAGTPYHSETIYKFVK